MDGVAKQLGDASCVERHWIDYPHASTALWEFKEPHSGIDAPGWVANFLQNSAGYAQSAWDHTDTAVREINTWADARPDAPILIIGYSQGNIVLRRAIPRLSPALRSRIRNVSLIADPTADATSIDKNITFPVFGKGQAVGIATMPKHLKPAAQLLISTATWRNAYKLWNDVHVPYPSDIAPRVSSICYSEDIVCDTNDMLDAMLSTKPGKGFELLFQTGVSILVKNPTVAKAATKLVSAAIWRTVKQDGVWQPLWHLHRGIETHTRTGHAPTYNPEAWGRTAARGLGSPPPPLSGVDTAVAGLQFRISLTTSPTHTSGSFPCLRAGAYRSVSRDWQIETLRQSIGGYSVEGVEASRVGKLVWNNRGSLVWLHDTVLNVKSADQSQTVQVNISASGDLLPRDCTNLTSKWRTGDATLCARMQVHDRALATFQLDVELTDRAWTRFGGCPFTVR